MPVRVWQEIQTLPRGAERRVALGRENGSATRRPNSSASASLQRVPFFRPFQFFDQTRCPFSFSGQGCNHHNPHRLRSCRRSGPTRSCRQPCPARWQRDRCQFFRRRVGSKAARTPARAGARSHSCCCARQPGQCSEYRGHVERRGGGCSRHLTANPGSQRQHHPRDRFCLRKFYARATQCSFRRQRRFLH
jgi:hypothetical protein